MEVRRATADDVAFLTEVTLGVLREQGQAPPGFDADAYRREYGAWTGEQLAAAGPSTTSVVLVDGERAGRLRVIREDRTIELAGVHLRPAYRGRGIGTALIRALQAEANAAGTTLVLGVGTYNPRARALYERLGFVVTGEQDGEHRMRWVPDPPGDATG